MSKTIVQDVLFKNTTPKDLYEIYMDADKHTIATGAPAEISAIPAIIIIPLSETAPLSPAARAKGTVSPSLIPITTSLKRSELCKCSSV